MPEWMLAALAGLAAGGALLAGAIIAWFVRIPRKAVAATMAFGAGVLVSALAFDLVLEAEEVGGFWPTVVGFAVGAVVYVVADGLLDRTGHRNRRGSDAGPGSGTGIAVGALIDGIPESAVLGVGMHGGAGVSVPVLVAIIISNVPEGLSSTADLKASGRSALQVMLLWGGIALACALAALGGYALLADAGGQVAAVVTALAAGAILAMICDTMIPEAFATERRLTGLLATFGFLLSFALHRAA
ncbi:ZIP family metal transporter [Agromyces marinus]|uniref:ZIP family zinc transporter n=1 Tax=Agromyces marinus TaxID=1389020 RepID=A0ABN6YDS4_9MICO|nr:ZIP family zinc transporter [Agromyces marinus]UIP58229.1 hypothetical protein DSM26151_11000 [Agromyces marinus]BDZ53528.1 ZIP family zinc transporter [Agromyces marinus]